ncbi:MAG: hypothetical protein NTY66_03900 [Candidatus Vogelbacteria bacterium]|nr:hypothetical protein [Candidatus Vogelbacteria bacterium]
MIKKIFIYLAIISIFSGYGLISAIHVGAEESGTATTTDELVPNIISSSTDSVLVASSSLDALGEPLATSSDSLSKIGEATTTATTSDQISSDDIEVAATSTGDINNRVQKSATSTDIGEVEKEATSTLPVVQLKSLEENIAPAGEIVSVSPNSVVNGVVPIKIQISDLGSGLANILFYLSDNNGTFLGETSQQDADGLYTIEWNTNRTKFSEYGPHYLYAAILGVGGAAYNSAWVPINVGR